MGRRSSSAAAFPFLLQVTLTSRNWATMVNVGFSKRTSLPLASHRDLRAMRKDEIRGKLRSDRAARSVTACIQMFGMLG